MRAATRPRKARSRKTNRLLNAAMADLQMAQWLPEQATTKRTPLFYRRPLYGTALL